MARIASGQVAENSSVWRCGGVLPMISVMASVKPMSSMRSASSSTSMRSDDKCRLRLRSSSCTRPGVPTTMCGSCAASEANCGPSAMPPLSVSTLMLGVALARRRISLLT